MSHWLEYTHQHLQLGEALITEGVDGLIRGWQASTDDIIGKICTGAERWQAAIRAMQAPTASSEILRTPEFVKSLFR
jgi:hypothetical protein